MLYYTSQATDLQLQVLFASLKPCPVTKTKWFDDKFNDSACFLFLF